jgi:hypothetical protein
MLSLFDRNIRYDKINPASMPYPFFHNYNSNMAIRPPRKHYHNSISEVMHHRPRSVFGWVANRGTAFRCKFFKFELRAISINNEKM